jgi:nicotinate-nucleotide pyrophosphorylase
MIIKEQRTISSGGGDKHRLLIIDWFDREWKIMLNDNHIKQITMVHLYDNDWRSFDGRTHEEAIVYDWIKQGKIVKLKYKVQ